MTQQTGMRRRFIATAGAASGAAALGFPAIVKAQTTSLRFQSTWPAKDIFHEYANDFAKKVNDMTGGELKIEVLPAGSVVPAFGLLDAVSKGTLDGGHGVLAYHYGKNNALALWGSGPAFGMDSNMLLSWHKYGGGKELLDKLYGVVGASVYSYVYGPMPTQPLGWFRNPIERAEQIRGLRYRTVGLATDLFQEMGAAVVALPGGEIVPALERGVIDGAEFNNPSSDRVLGFADVARNYMIQSFHQRVETFEVLWNRQRYEGLPQELQQVLRISAEASSADMSWKQQDRYSRDLVALAQAGVNVRQTPRAILDAQLQAWDRVIARQEGDNSSPAAGPFFKKVCDSQREWCRRVGGFYLRYEASPVISYNHFFARG